MHAKFAKGAKGQTGRTSLRLPLFSNRATNELQFLGLGRDNMLIPPESKGWVFQGLAIEQLDRANFSKVANDAFNLHSLIRN